MIAVIFEAQPAEGQWEHYLEIAARLKKYLVKIDGFISVERFQSISNPDKVLSLSFWRDEESVAEWRNLEMHRAAQTEGRATVFAGYRLRVAAVLRDYGMEDREQAPADSKNLHQ